MMAKALNQLRIKAALNKNNQEPLSQSEIMQTYMVAKPLLDKFKQGEADQYEIQNLYELYTMASFMCDHMQKQTAESAQELLQQRKQAVYDGGGLLLMFIAALRDNEQPPKLTGNLIRTVHAGYVAACEIIETGTQGAYYGAMLEILTIELEAERKRLGIKTKPKMKKRRKK